MHQDSAELVSSGYVVLEPNSESEYASIHLGVFEYATYVNWVFTGYDSDGSVMSLREVYDSRDLTWRIKTCCAPTFHTFLVLVALYNNLDPVSFTKNPKTAIDLDSFYVTWLFYNMVGIPFNFTKALLEGQYGV